MLTLERNRQWWTTEPLLSGSERVSFPQSKLVWEYYPGQGIQIQWLATFGKANGYYLSGHENANLRALLAEAIPLASERAGRHRLGIPVPLRRRPAAVDERPLAGHRGAGARARVLALPRTRLPDRRRSRRSASSRRPRRTACACTPPPAPSTPSTPTRPSDRILNGFIQALVGLYDYTSITQDPLGQRLFEEGDAEARVEVPHYDTGAWSLYDQYGESDLNYHELLTEFLVHLCERTQARRAAAAAAATARHQPTTPAPPPTTTTPTTTTPAPPSGGSPPGGSARSAAAHSAQIVLTPAPAGDAIYCTTAQRFTADERTPPTISLLTSTLRAGTRAGVQVSLSKISTVRLTIRKGSRVVWTNGATVEGGKPKLLWVTPSSGGSFSVTLSATDLAGNFSTAQGAIKLTRH